MATIRVTQGTRDEFYDLRVVGITDGQQYALQPAMFSPFFTWDRVRPKSEAEVNGSHCGRECDPHQTGEGVSKRLMQPDSCIRRR